MVAGELKASFGIRLFNRAAQLVAAAILLTATLYGQYNYLVQTGAPTFTATEAVELGFVNVANSNLHNEIAIGAPPQRGSIAYTGKLVYDSRIWKIVNNGGSQSWQPTNVPGSQGGWRFVTTANAGTVTYNTTTTSCGGGNTYTTYSNFGWMAPDGTRRLFYITTRRGGNCLADIASADAPAQDSSGYHMFVTSFTTATVYARDGTIVADQTQTAYTVKDPNGNFFTTDASANVIDTLNRTPALVSTSGSQTFYDVLNSQNARSRFTVTTQTINVSTNFGQSGVTEYSGTITVIQSIALPDGTSYTFTYDSGTAPGNYGLLKSVTLPTGGLVTYTFTNYSDSYGNVNRWVNTRVSGGGTWTYAPAVISTCTPSGVGCQQKVTLTRPSGDDTVYIFTLNNGAWNAETDSYNGSSSTGTLLRTVTQDFDFSIACPTGCPGAAYIRPIRLTTTFPTVGGGSISRKSEFTYDSPSYGNVTALKDWKYYTGTPPASADRETDTTYVTTASYINKNMISLPSSVIVKNAAGTRISETDTTYDSTSLTSVTGITHHDDTNYGLGNTVRGNPTVVSQWVSGTSFLSTTSYNDTTGQVTKVTDPAANNTLYSYADSFFTDASPPANPPAAYTPSSPTNAYGTQITLPVSGTQSFGYYFGSGRPGVSTEQNNAAVYYHNLDSLDRLTHIYSPPGGWKLTAYTSSTQQDIYTGLTDTTPSSGCTGCRHDQIILDSLGRVTRNTLSSDPAGPTNVDTAYDSSGRAQSKSNPYRSTSDPTYGLDTYAYDGVNRATSLTHADSNIARTYYGAAVSGGGGISAQLCASSIYGIGFPTLSVDEMGMKRQNWADGFGNTIEVDEPDSSGSLTLGTCYKYDVLNNLTEVDQGVQTRTYAYDGLSRKTSETTPEGGTTNFYFTNSSGGLCAGGAGKVCRRTDARNVTITYGYDAENRVTSKTYSDTTPAANLYYDEASFTLNGTVYTLTNTKGRLSHTSAASATAITIHSYDAAGQLQDLWQCTPFNCSSATIWNMHYTYNLAGGVTSWTHPQGFTITNTVTNAQRISQISSSLNDSTHPGTLATITYVPQGAASTLQDGCAGAGCTQIQETYDYNNRLQSVRIQLGTSTTPAANACVVYNYYSGLANPTSCVVPSQATSGNDGNAMGYFLQDTTNPSLGHTATFTYDNAMRLATSVATGSATHNLTFSYDRYGNMTCVTNAQTNGVCPNWTFNASTNQITNSNFTYDAAGDLTQNGTGTGTHTFQWDGESRLISVDSGTTATYTYNALGQRVEKNAGGAYTEYAFDASGETIGEHNRSTWAQAWVPFHGRHLAHYQSSATYFTHPNTLGSTAQVTDYAGAMAQDQLFYPWGQEWSMVGTSQEKRFARLQHRHAESTLDPTFYRMYSPAAGRWLSPDPLFGSIANPQEFNRYAYVANNPTNLTDPTGGTWICFPDFGSCYYALTQCIRTGAAPWYNNCYNNCYIIYPTTNPNNTLPRSRCLSGCIAGFGAYAGYCAIRFIGCIIWSSFDCVC